MNTSILSFSINTWDATSISQDTRLEALQGLEHGNILFFPHLPFSLEHEEQALLTPACLSPKRKNVSFDAKRSRLGGTCWQGQRRTQLQSMMQRYADQSTVFVQHLLSHYSKHLQRARTSYRPAAIDKRKLSPYKDDTRLHVDAFPSAPTQGQRILRIFTNVNRQGQARHWRIGEPFSAVVERFIPQIRRPLPFSGQVLKALKITKSYRTPYDHYMLHMHNRMKCNENYQVTVAQEAFAFPPNSTWMVFTDQVSHAAMSGQYLFEQTFHLPVNSLFDPSTSPLQVLERFLKCPLTR